MFLFILGAMSSLPLMQQILSLIKKECVMCSASEKKELMNYFPCGHNTCNSCFRLLQKTSTALHHLRCPKCREIFNIYIHFPKTTANIFIFDAHVVSKKPLNVRRNLLPEFTACEPAE